MALPASVLFQSPQAQQEPKGSKPQKAEGSSPSPLLSAAQIFAWPRLTCLFSFIQSGTRDLFQGGCLSKMMGSVIHPVSASWHCSAFLWFPLLVVCQSCGILALLLRQHQPFCCCLTSDFLMLPTKIPVPFFFFFRGGKAHKVKTEHMGTRKTHLPFCLQQIPPSRSC